MSASEWIHGLHAVEALIARSPERIEELLLTPGRRDQRLLRLRESAVAVGIVCRDARKDDFERHAGDGVHQGVLARVRRVFDLSADPDAIGRDLSADPALKPLVAARPGLRLPGEWIDDGDEAPNDRLDDETLATRAETWRPWRAYGALHLALAGISGADLMESDDAKCAA